MQHKQTRAAASILRSLTITYAGLARGSEIPERVGLAKKSTVYSPTLVMKAVQSPKPRMELQKYAIKMLPGRHRSFQHHFSFPSWWFG